MDSSRQLELLGKLNASFRPYAPIDALDLFAGRLAQASAVLETVYESGRHAVIYGDRGVGKTSLANVIGQLLERQPAPGDGAPVIRLNCDSSDDFCSVWQRAFGKLTFSQRVPSLGLVTSASERQMTFAQLLPDDLKPADVVAVAESLGRIVVVFDEFDRLQRLPVRRAFADTLKALSDLATEFTVVLVGVGTDIRDLVGEHESVERCIRQIQMPRMSDAETESIVKKGIDRSEMTIHEEGVRQIVRLSQGFPHYTHLLARNAGGRTIGREATEVTKDDVEIAISSALEQAEESIKNLYNRAVLSQRRDSIFEDVLLACARASELHAGSFSAGDIREPLARITGFDRAQPQYSYNLGKLCLPERGSVLEKLDYPGRSRYRFRNPLVEPYVLLRGHQRGR